MIPLWMKAKSLHRASAFLLRHAVKSYILDKEAPMKASEYLKARRYPGRIIGMGRTGDGRNAVIYAIMGRSKGSRNRIFSISGNTLRTLPFDDTGTGDPALTIYTAVIKDGKRIIAANGSHSELIGRETGNGRTLLEALGSCTYEPDAPSYTPRIAGIMEDDGSFSLGIARKGEGDHTERETFSYAPMDGKIHLIHTYMDDGDPLPSFRGSPELLDLEGSSASEIAAVLWDSLDRENRVSLYVSIGDDEKIINRHERTDSIKLKYGLNPNQAEASISITGRALPITVLNGRPGYINFMDALNGYQLVSAMRKVLGMPAAASFKHVSPSGAAVSVPLSDEERKMYFVRSGEELSDLAVSYIRARGTDRMSSFGDFIALSDICDGSTARVIRKEVSDGIIAPGFTPEALEILRPKKKGAYPIISIDPDYIPDGKETRTLYGMTLEEPRNEWLPGSSTFSNIVTVSKDLPEEARRDLIVALLTLKYTQSNSVCYAYNGQTIGVGAGQQSRIHCTRLAGDKADRWNLRKSGKVLSLPFRKELSRNDRDNVIEQYLSDSPELDVIADWQQYFTERPEAMTKEEKMVFLSSVRDIALASDAFFPFSDNITRAYRSGVGYIAEPGGSMRDSDVIAAADRYGMTMAFTGIRLFHH